MAFIKRDVTELLKIKYPIIQGAMAHISDEYLVGAVSNAGGLGVLTSGFLNADSTRVAIRKIREITNSPFAVNIAMFMSNSDDIAQVIIDERVPVVTTGGGDPSRYIAHWKQKNITIMPIVATVASAKKVEAAGADLVVAEGMEAGGHIGKQTTMVLVPQIVDAIDIPVVAAGGIADGRGMAAAFMLGASGVQIGTRFIVAKECRAHKNYKAAILSAIDTSTTITGAYLNLATRCLKNKLTEKMEEYQLNNVPIEEFKKLRRGALREAVVDGNVEFGSVMCGQSAGLVTHEQSASNIIEEIMMQYYEIINEIKRL